MAGSATRGATVGVGVLVGVGDGKGVVARVPDGEADSAGLLDSPAA